MLYDVVLGMSDDRIKKEKWSLINDNGCLFLAKDCIHQRIRIDNNIESFALTLINSSQACDEFYIKNIMKIVSNNKNMNPAIVDSSDTDLPIESNHIIYVTIGDKYKILGYNTPHKIMVTYHEDKSYQGCMMSFTEEAIQSTENGFVLSVRVVDKSTGKYKFINIHINKERHCDVTIENVRNPEVIKSLRNLDTKYYKRFSLGFKVKNAVYDEPELLTAVYIVTPKTKKQIEELTKDITNRRIIVVPHYIESNATKLHDFIKVELERIRGVRAITEVGIELPIALCSELRILYVFYYNTDDNTIICKKSN